MSFTPAERQHIREVMGNEIRADELRDYLPEHVYNFLVSKNNLRTIQDRIIIVNKNKFRPFDSVTITKFLNNDTNPAKLIENLLSKISPSFLVFIDFHFLYIAKKQTDEPNLKFQGASKTSAFNSNVKITDTKHFYSLLGEFKNKTFADMLSLVSSHHTEMYEYQDSGLRPYCLLSLVVHIQKFLART